MRSKKAEENIELLKKNKIFSTGTILLRGVECGLGGSHVASVDLGGSRLVSGDRMWSQGVASGLGRSGGALGVTNFHVGLHLGLRVASLGHG